MKPKEIANLFADLPSAAEHEAFDLILGGEMEHGHMRLERIVSAGQATPPGEWYEQPTAEWVLVLRGEAGLRFAHEDEPRRMRPGDHVLIPARCRHRVEWTSAEERTVWLALHFGPA